jgi:hypothetical protein
LWRSKLAALVVCVLHAPVQLAAPAHMLFAAAYGEPTVWMTPYSAPDPSGGGGGGLSMGVIIGIAVGGGVALLAVAVLLYCCCCRGGGSKEQHGSGKSMDDELEAGQHWGDGRGAPPAGPSQLTQAQKLYAQQQAAAKGLLYGSAYSNGAPGSSGAAAAAAAAAATAATLSAGSQGQGHHSRNASLESGAGMLGSDLTTPGINSDDPLLEWILKTQSPPTTGSTATSAAVAAVAAATAAGAGPSGSGDGSVSGSGQRGTPRHSRGPSKTLDVRVWQFNFRDLEIQKQIGEGSFGRVSAS